VGDHELAFRLFLLASRRASDWLDRRILALDGATPRSLLKTRAGRRRLRSLAARFPR